MSSMLRAAICTSGLMYTDAGQAGTESAKAAAPVRFTEMLPGPDECWLEHEGERYTSELRLVAVDLSRRGAGQVAMPSHAAGREDSCQAAQ